MACQCWWIASLPVSTLSALKLPQLLMAVEPSPTLSRLAARPPKALATCEAGGICSNDVARPVTPHANIVWLCGVYALAGPLCELAGQSIISNGVTTYWVVSYGVYAQPILYGLPSGAVAVANGTPRLVTASGVVQGIPSLPIGLKRTFCVGGAVSGGAGFTASCLW